MFCNFSASPLEICFFLILPSKKSFCFWIFLSNCFLALALKDSLPFLISEVEEASPSESPSESEPSNPSPASIWIPFPSLPSPSDDSPLESVVSLASPSPASPLPLSPFLPSPIVTLSKMIEATSIDRLNTSSVDFKRSMFLRSIKR